MIKLHIHIGSHKINSKYLLKLQSYLFLELSIAYYEDEVIAKITQSMHGHNYVLLRSKINELNENIMQLKGNEILNDVIISCDALSENTLGKDNKRFTYPNLHKRLRSLKRNLHNQHAPIIFHLLWRKKYKILLGILPFRWLISVLLTFADHGVNETQPRSAST